MTENVRAQVYAKLTMIARELKEAGVEMPDYSGVDSLEDVEEYILRVNFVWRVRRLYY